MLEFETLQGESVYNKSPQAKPQKLLILRFVTFVLPILVICLAVGGFIAMSAFKPTPEEKEDVVKAIPVLTARAQTDDVVLKVQAQGEVQPRTQIGIVPQVSGKITYMSPQFIEGGKFKKGDYLIRIDPAEYELRVVQARAGVAQAQTLVTQEKSEAAIALSDWQDIGNGGAPSALTLREPQVAETIANLEAAKAQLAEAELQLSRTALYAPFNGRVIARTIDQGEFVTAGTRLGEIYAIDVMDVRLPLTNNDLRQAGLTLGYEAKGTDGIPVTLSADIAGRFSQWQAYIVRTDSGFDTQTRVLYAYAEVRDPFGTGSDDGTPLAPGIYVDAQIDGQTLENITTIPRAALRGEDQVYVATDEGTLTIKTVTVLSSDRHRAVIGAGLEPGEAVIMSPIRGVVEGLDIEVSSTTGTYSETTVSGDAP